MSTGIEKVMEIIVMYQRDELTAPVAIDRIERLFFIGLIGQAVCDRAHAEIQNMRSKEAR